MSRPDATLRTLAAKGITHVVGLPDRISGPLFDVVRRHPAIRLVTVTREGEAFALAAGLWIGGCRPLVVVRSTGLLDSGDSLRGTAQRLSAPVPILVTAGVQDGAAHDTATLLVEPTLSAWNVPWTTCGIDGDPAEALEHTIEAARERTRPVALVVSRGIN